MKQWKSNIGLYVLLGMLAVFFCWFLCGRYGIFGSKVDWISQHSVLPDYFRQQFYETGEIFPEFAANIGGGQNIYCFAYYGLYSPVILLSYFFPFVKMGDYMMISGVLCLMASVMLMYGWLRKRGFSGKISFFTAWIYLLSGPMIFHSYSQVMFVNYMPFLCLAFMGVDRFFEKRKSGLYTISVFLMIMTSFYFSIGGMLALGLYGLHRYFQMQDKEVRKVTVFRFLSDGFRFLMPMMTAVLMSGILLVPTAVALLGRGGSSSGSTQVFGGAGIVSMLKLLLIPDIQILRLLYTPYGIGLTTVAITVLVTGLCYRKSYERVLVYGCIIVLTVPLFAFLLNGGLYIRDKAMIPFLPLLCYLMADYFRKQENKEITFMVGGISYIVTAGILYVEGMLTEYSKYWEIIVIEALLMLVGFLIYWQKRNLLLIMAPPIIFLILYGGVFHIRTEQIESHEFYQKVTDKRIESAIDEILSQEDGYYRMEQKGTDKENAANLNRISDMEQNITSLYSSSYNEEYLKFRDQIFGLNMPFRNYLMQSVSGNPVWLRFMGVKYLISSEEIPGYELYGTVDGQKIWVNEEVAPIIYATDKVMSEEMYQQLEFPYNQTAFLSHAVLEDATDMKKEEDVKDTDDIEAGGFELPEKKDENIEIIKKDKGYCIHAKKKTEVPVRLPNKDKVTDREEVCTLFLRFQVKNYHPRKDIAIWLNGERNKLTADTHIYYNGNTTFTYAVPLDCKTSEVNIIFGAGEYEITDMEYYLMRESYKSIEEKGMDLYQSEFIVDKGETKGNRITGMINVKKEGALITTIPYDENFEMLLDGKRVDIEKVNMAFLGCKIGEGEHKVEIVYHAHGIGLGKLLSMVGFLLFLLQIIYRKQSRHCADFF